MPTTTTPPAPAALPLSTLLRFCFWAAVAGLATGLAAGVGVLLGR